MSAQPVIKKDIIKLREEWRKLPNYGCFWSSPDNDRGLRLTPTIAPGLVSVDMKIDREHSGYPGIAHGGIAYTILDGLMSWYLMSHEGRAGFTVKAATSYFAPLKVGNTYSFEVTCDETVAPTQPGFIYLIGKAFNLGESAETRKALVEIKAQFILPNRALAKKVLGLELGKHGEDLFPET